MSISNQNLVDKIQKMTKLIDNLVCQIATLNNEIITMKDDINKSKLLIEVKDCVRKANIHNIEFAKSDNPILENPAGQSNL